MVSVSCMVKTNSQCNGHCHGHCTVTVTGMVKTNSHCALYYEGRSGLAHDHSSCVRAQLLSCQQSKSHAHTFPLDMTHHLKNAPVSVLFENKQPPTQDPSRLSLSKGAVERPPWNVAANQATHVCALLCFLLLQCSVNSSFLFTWIDVSMLMLLFVPPWKNRMSEYVYIYIYIHLYIYIIYIYIYCI